MRRRYNKTSSCAPNLRPTRTQPHGCGARCATLGRAPTRVRAPPRQQQAPATHSSTTTERPRNPVNETSVFAHPRQDPASSRASETLRGHLAAEGAIASDQGKKQFTSQSLMTVTRSVTSTTPSLFVSAGHAVHGPQEMISSTRSFTSTQPLPLTSAGRHAIERQRLVHDVVARGGGAGRGLAALDGAIGQRAGAVA